jgi:hypothetical protein
VRERERVRYLFISLSLSLSLYFNSFFSLLMRGKFTQKLEKTLSQFFIFSVLISLSLLESGGKKAGVISDTGDG